MKKLRRWFRKIVKTKLIHVCIIVLIIFALVIFAYVKIKEYDVKGEKEMPFEVSKINVISSVSGENIDFTTMQSETQQPATPNRWDLTISQNNDFYIYIEKNNEYKGRKQEAISSVVIDNIEIQRNIEQGEEKLYKPSATSEKELFKNVEENEINSIQYSGAPESDVKNLQMSNQGDLIYFRFTSKDIAKYSSNEEELNYSQLLQKAGMSEESLKIKIKFDLTINLVSNKTFKTTVDAEVPVEGIVEKGTTTGELIDVNKLIFKRN